VEVGVEVGVEVDWEGRSQEGARRAKRARRGRTEARNRFALCTGGTPVTQRVRVGIEARSLVSLRDDMGETPMPREGGTPVPRGV
jgi:hypothetical protein